MQSINIVWFKRDLRLSDHEPLCAAADAHLPVLLIYIFEPSIFEYSDSAPRHWRFAYESLLEMNKKLSAFGLNIILFKEEAKDVFKKVCTAFDVRNVWSYQETGNSLTFERDKTVSAFLNSKSISWKEFSCNGIIRAAKNRIGWDANWNMQMGQPLQQPNFNKLKQVEWQQKQLQLPEEFKKSDALFQPGGSEFGQRYLQSFLQHRCQFYAKHISQPYSSRKSCSRISPYLAFGNLSMREVYQQTLIAVEGSANKRQLHFFIARLHWHCHFIQKFEQACSMEFFNLNKGFNGIRTACNDEWIKLWEKGETGYPLVDACICCLKATGYINFRMRSMLVSFFTHHMWQPWQAVAHFLARLFLDYEPGIHYSQIQMQAGTMGVNTIRIYNPIKQSIEQDPNGVFIKKWLPQLAQLPIQFIHEPWLMSEMEQQLYACVLGQHYPKPMLDVGVTAKFARINLWAIKKSSATQKENVEVLKQHVRQVKRANNGL